VKACGPQKKINFSAKREVDARKEEKARGAIIVEHRTRRESNETRTREYNIQHSWIEGGE
jgi:hypothetical protein